MGNTQVVAQCNCMAHQMAATRNFLTRADVDALHQIASSLPLQANVVDLGAGSGTTALAIFHVRPKAHIFTVDHSETAMNWTQKAIENMHYVEQWSRTVADSWQAFDLAGGIDLLMIDAGHDYEDVKRDFEAWAPQLVVGRPVWFHDYASDYPDVTRYVDELLMAGTLVLPVHSEGEWGITTRLGVKVVAKS